MKTNDTNENDRTTKKSALNTIRLIIIAAVVVAYGLFIFFLMDKIESEELYWTRLIFIFSSLEAIAFAALGYVFGKEITKKVAKTAELAQREAEKKASYATEELQKERTKGLALGGMIVGNFPASEPMMSSIQEISERDDNDNSKARNPHFLVEKAKEFYPELR